MMSSHNLIQSIQLRLLLFATCTIDPASQLLVYEVI